MSAMYLVRVGTNIHGDSGKPSNAHQAKYTIKLLFVNIQYPFQKRCSDSASVEFHKFVAEVL